MKSFKLDKEPWIPVVSLGGEIREIGLCEAFSKAHDLARISGTPVEVAALTRFMLAIAHLTRTPTSLDEWKHNWSSKRAFMSECAEYVAMQGDVWDLLHPDHPFGQVAGLGRTPNPAHILVYEAARKNNPVHVDHSLESTPEPVPLAKLARNIIAANAFAGSSGGGYRSGPLVVRTVSFLEGQTLADTLVLNLLVQAQAPFEFDWTTYGQPSSHNVSTLDVSRRYLWASRTVRLIPDEEGVVRRIMLTPGDDMPESERKEDPMVVMRKNAEGTDYVPLRLDPSRALWRSAHVLLSSQPPARRLAAVDQLAKLLRRGHVDFDLPVVLRVCGVAGDAQGPASDLWRDESLPFGLSVLSDDDRFASLVRSVASAEDCASNVRNRIYSFAARYLQNGAEAKPDKNDIAKLRGELSPDLADFWAEVAPMGERIACDDFDEAKWAELLKKAADNAYRKAIDRLPPDARRFRAEFARSERAESKQKQGATA